MANCLVTGGAGFVGSHVADALATEKHRVIVFDDFSGGSFKNLKDGRDWVDGSIVDPSRVFSVFKHYPIDYVFHFAAYAAEGLSHFVRRHNYLINLMGSINLVNEAVKHHVKGFVFASSAAVYGDSMYSPLHECSPCFPVDPYGIAKLAVEQDLCAAHKVFGLPYIVFRCHNLFGERQPLNDRYRNVVGIFLRQILTGEPLTVFGDGGQRRQFTYIGDVVPVIAKSISMPEVWNQVYNLGGDQDTRIIDLARCLANSLWVRNEPSTPIKFLPARHEVRNVLVNHDKAREAFDWEATTSLHDGLEKTMSWIAANGWSKDVLPGPEIEITRNLPESWLSSNLGGING